MKNKLWFIVFLFFTVKSKGQQVEVKVEKVDSFKCVVNVVVQNGKDSLKIIGETALNDFLCGLYGDIGLDLQILEGDCYADLSFDCEPKYKIGNPRFTYLMPLTQLNYCYDISRKIIKHPRYKNLQGSYRFKVFFRYTNNKGNVEVASTSWQYLIF